MIFHLRLASLGVALVLATPDTSSAQSYSWRNVEIGGGGFVTGVVFHPTEPGLVYARTDVGGSYRLDTTSNRWIALNDDIGGLNNEFQHLGVLTIGLDPNDANRVYIATGQYAGTESWKLPSRIYRSTDRGNTWSYTTPGFKMGGNGEGRGTGERMAVDPVNGANILIGTSSDGIWRSTDHGATWSKMTGFPLTTCNFVLYAPANHANPGPNRRAYAAANTLTGQSFWFSDDNGTTWAEVPNHPGKTIGSETMPIQGSFDAAGVFYSTWGDQTGPSNYATHYGVWKLSADATTWTSILPPTGQGFFSGISADPRVAGHVVVSTLERWWPGDEVYRSTDGGVTWTAALRTGTRSAGNSPWSASVGAHWMSDINIDPFNSDRAIFNNGFGLIQTTNLSTSGTARTWTFFSDGLEELVPLGLLSPTAGPPLVSVVGDYCGFRHDNLGRSPLRGSHSPGSGSTSIVSGADLAPANMIRQNSSVTYFSKDAGATWAGFPTSPAPVVNGQNRVIFSTDGQHVLWCPPNSPAYVSNNLGASWTVAANSGAQINTGGTPTVDVLAGTAGVPGSTNATGGSASFNSPSAIALDSAGIRYVADTANHLIRRIVANSGVNTLAGGAGVSGSTDATGTNARFSSPSGITVDSVGNVFVSDTGNHTIRKITSAGVVTTLAGSAGVPGSTDATTGANARFLSPGGLTIDAGGNLYVCDTGNHTIRKITAAGVVSTIAGSAGVSGNTNANGTNARFSSPQGIALDSSGNLYVADTGNHAIRKVTPAGDVSTFAGLAGTSGSADGSATTARFNNPKAITIDVAGNLDVADTGNHTIRKITSAGAVSTVAGLAGSAGSTVGNGSSARFNAPSGIAVTPDGYNLYIADTGNHTIRRGYLYNTLTPLADRVDGNRFYLWDGTAKRMLTSSNGGASFAVAATGMNSAFAGFHTVPGINGAIWARAGSSGLYRSTDYGASFTKISSVAEVYQFDFGKAKPGASHPAVFIWGKVGTIVGFFRSDDTGATWTRINDDLHNFGYQGDLAGDPRVYGRVYLATSGRGVIYGEIANPTPPSQPSQMVYDDALASGWTNASPSGTSLTSTNPVRRGTSAVSVPSGTNKGFAAICASRSLEGFAAFAFWVNAGTSTPPPLQVGVSRGGIALEADPITVPATAGWQRLVVPFTDLGISNIPDLTGLRIESRMVNGVTPGAFSLDDIELVGSNDYYGITTGTVTLSNLAQTFDGTPKSVTVTTVPAGLPVTVTYNGSATAPTNVGSYAISATFNDPAVTGSATGTLVITKATASILLTNLIPTADGTPKTPTVTTSPPGLQVGFTFNGSGTAPTYAGSYNVVATISDAYYQGDTSATMIIRQPELPATGITGWSSNIAGKITGGSSSSPLLNPNDPTDPYSTNTLQANFSPITLANTGDKITLTGSLQLTAAGVASQGNWFRFGLYDNQGQAPGTATGWLGLTGMGNSLYERTATGLFSTGTGATQRTPDGSPTPVSSTSPAGNPPVAFEVTATRTASGVVFTHKLTRTDTSTVLMSYTYTDTTPNNNGLLGSAQSTAANYTPTYNTAGFAFARTYIGSSGASAQFSNIQVAFIPGVAASPQFITFPPPADRAVTSPAFDLAATASSGLPVAFSLSSGPATLSGSTLTLTGAGTVTIRASQPGNLTYLPAADVNQSFNITKAPATITLGDLNPTYDGSPKAVSFTTNPASLQADIIYDAGSTNAPTNAGSHSVTATINNPTYQGNATGTLVIAQAPQTITFASPPDHTFGDAPFPLTASSDSGLPVAFSVVSGPASISGNSVTLEGAGTVVVEASQAGDSNHLAAAPVQRAISVGKAPAGVTLANLSTSFDGQPKPVGVSTTPVGLNVIVTYDGSPTVPSAVGSYAVVAAIDDPDYQGGATGTLVIGRRSFSTPITGWKVTNSTQIAGADTASPLLNSTNGIGTAGASVSFFAGITEHVLSAVGDAVKLNATVTVNTPAGAGNQGLWFRFGLYDNPNSPGSLVVNNWLGYTAMAQASATNSLYERVGGTSSGDFATSIFGTAARTPDASPAYVGANSPTGVVTLLAEQTITRTAGGVTVVSRLASSGTTYLSSTYTDTTPNNNGVNNGTSQTTPLSPVYSPLYNAVGFVLSGAYINTTNPSSVQFSNATLTYTPGTDAAPQTITFAPPGDHVYGDAPFALSASADSGLPISLEVLSGPATLNGNILSVTDVGDVTIRATQAGDYSFLPALPADQTFTVGKAPAAVTLGNLTQVYDGLPKSASVTTAPVNLAVAVTYDGGPANPVTTGNHDVTAVINDDHYTGSASGTLVIAPAHTALENWRFDKFQTYENSGNAADDADPDHDGLTNLLEYALHLDPNAPSTVPATLVINGNTLEFTYTRDKAAMADLSIIVEHSDTLDSADWTNSDVTEISPPLADDGTTQTVKVTLPAGTGRRFVRLKVFTPP